jgi:general stress protein 26
MDQVLHPNLVEDFQKLGGLIKEIPVAMLITHDENGRIHSRPMMTQQVEFDGDLWFFASEGSHKLEEIDWNRQVHVIYLDVKKGLYLAISGTALMVQDSEKAKKLWRPIYQAWFPKGLEDPELVLLKVEVDTAEYWEITPGSSFEVGRYSKASLSRKAFAGENTEHKKMDLAG